MSEEIPHLLLLPRSLLPPWTRRSENSPFFPGLRGVQLRVTREAHDDPRGWERSISSQSWLFCKGDRFLPLRGSFMKFDGLLRNFLITPPSPQPLLLLRPSAR